MVKRNRTQSQRAEDADDGLASRMEAVFRTIALDCRDPERVLEVYYLSKLPGLLEMVRAIAALPHHPHTLLRHFLTTARPHLISAEIDEFARLILSSPDVTDGLVMSSAKDGER
jgi:hypothetical protein